MGLLPIEDGKHELVKSWTEFMLEHRRTFDRSAVGGGEALGRFSLSVTIRYKIQMCGCSMAKADLGENNWSTRVVFVLFEFFKKVVM